MVKTLQWIMVAPDGTETLLYEMIARAEWDATWHPTTPLPHPYGMRRKGSDHDADWEQAKQGLMKESRSLAGV